MLIRSQDKSILLLLDNIGIDIDNSNTYDGVYVVYGYGSEASWELGYYSSKEKAIKVLDMIQAAYAAYESNKIVHVGRSISVYTGNYDTKENTIHGIKVLKEYAKTLVNMFTFQMPKDSEVEA